jgi:hypothetical protein
MTPVEVSSYWRERGKQEPEEPEEWDMLVSISAKWCILWICLLTHPDSSHKSPGELWSMPQSLPPEYLVEEDERRDFPFQEPPSGSLNLHLSPAEILCTLCCGLQGDENRTFNVPSTTLRTGWRSWEEHELRAPSQPCYLLFVWTWA